SFPPFASALAENKRLLYAGEQQITELLAAGITPVLFGDVVMDTKQGACIISGDQLAPYLARVLSAERVGIVTSAGGVLDEGEVVPILSRGNVGKISFTAADCADVTGGMKGKVDELLSLSDDGIDSQIFAPEKLADFLNGNNPGTRITHE
ncbi:MAG TPA: uridylate kinase, partial [Methanocorpusculum sp.]|nr:uridylate kinase [Methanocorpusculum sp.]